MVRFLSAVVFPFLLNVDELSNPSEPRLSHSWIGSRRWFGTGAAFGGFLVWLGDTAATSAFGRPANIWPAQTKGMADLNGNARQAREKQMDDSGMIARICVEMIGEEERGDADAQSYFGKILDETFLFRNAKGKIFNKDDFLKDLKKRAEQGRVFEPPGVDVSYYEDLAVASLRIRTKDGLFRNIRIFGSGANGWQVRMWYNNQIA